MRSSRAVRSPDKAAQAIAGQGAAMRGVSRTLQVLRALNENNGERVATLSRITGVPRPSLYRILEALRSLGYVRRRADGETYELTIQVRTLSDGFSDEAWMRQAALPVMQQLQQEILWPTDIATFFGDAMYLRETTRRQSPLTIDGAKVGLRLPMLKSATGKAYLTWCDQSEREMILEHLRRSSLPEDAAARDARFVRSLLAATRRNGYGEQSREIFPKTAAIAVPVFGADRVVGCLNISFIASALEPKEAAARYLGALKSAAKAIETRLENAPHTVRHLQGPRR